MPNTKLHPCPCCGNEPYRDSSADCTGGPMVGCLCGAHITGGPTQNDVDAAWNLRSAPPVGTRVKRVSDEYQAAREAAGTAGNGEVIWKVQNGWYSIGDGKYREKQVIEMTAELLRRVSQQ